ncbi:YihY/virulence factor BrkB family protein [Roseateles cellulosilyticus]|uniref:YihY/virulence factor BrkB family protein n=1 Tax=Pelomonas cellulosilytica TaxID=2906762 RepID=A0ABS8XS79_9BURK|nr:YihY/virulence factor BrkB family protein [Pelomonas sp. P8]MCE4554557.1 YihY/virulence factor BrkB family protein [Pelomonas sp. P8]
MHWLDLRERLRPLARVLQMTLDGFLDDRGPRMGAALAYYTLFSLAPLLLIVVSVAGLVWGGEAVRGELVEQLGALLGPGTASTVEQMLRSVAWPAGGWLHTALGLGLMVVGATTVFAELQDALDTIWRVPARPIQGWWAWLRARLLSFGLILGLSFLLLVSLLLGAALSAAETWWRPWFGGWMYVAALANLVVSQGLVVAVFALIFKWMPRARIAWRDVLLGALVTAGLFELGRRVIGAYLQGSGVASAFGAAASVVALLVWVYFSAQILLLGAEFTWAYARVLGSRQPAGENTERNPQASS